jgi:hypothetical protein
MYCRRAFSVALGLSLGSAAVLENAASAEPIGTLFGIRLWAEPTYYQPQSAVYPAYKTYAHRRVRPKRLHALRKANPNQDGGKPQPSELAERLAAMQKMKPGTLDIFLSDPTLKRSDAVMTNVGIFIFKGGAGEHTPKDFASLAQTKPIAHRAELVAIQRVSVPRFEVAQLEKPKPNKIFEDIRQSTKTFETIEPKSVRRIAGIEAF